MARAIIKNPVGNVGDVREDVKAVLTLENNVQYFTITLSKRNENYSAKFHYSGSNIVVDSVNGGEDTAELTSLLNSMDDVYAITNMNKSFYDLAIIEEESLMYQMKDLEEIIETYLNGGIVPGQIDELGYWKTLFYKDGDKYIIGDKLSGNDITVWIKDEEVWFAVQGAEVQNTGFDLITADVVENVFSKATEDGSCYLPLTRYEELLEYLGTKLSEFQNDSRFVEKEYSNLRWTNAHFETDSQGMLWTAKYNNVLYSARLNLSEEIEVSYAEGGNATIANMFGEILENNDLGEEPIRQLLNYTYFGIDQLIEAEVEGVKEERGDEIFEYILNNGVEASAKLYEEDGLVRIGLNSDGSPIFHLLRGEEGMMIYQRVSDRYAVIDEDYSVLSEDLLSYFWTYGFVPLEIYEKLESLDYAVVPATGVSIEPSSNTVEVGGTAIGIYKCVLPSDTGDYQGESFATNDDYYWLMDTPGIITVQKEDELNEPDLITGVEVGTVNLTCITADGGFSQTVQITSESQGPEITNVCSLVNPGGTDEGGSPIKQLAIFGTTNSEDRVDIITSEYADPRLTIVPHGVFASNYFNIDASDRGLDEPTVNAFEILFNRMEITDDVADTILANGGGLGTLSSDVFEAFETFCGSPTTENLTAVNDAIMDHSDGSRLIIE